MSVSIRPYKSPDDFHSVGDFLITHFAPGNRDGNWLQPAWEYMHSHPYLDESSLERIGIWEASGAIVGVANYEHQLGEAFFQLHPAFTHLKQEMLAYAETHLFGETESGKIYLRVYVNDLDKEFERILASCGYEKDIRYDRPLLQFVIPRPFPPVEILEGYRLKSLADENNLAKIHRVLWRGFGHPGEPPEDGISDRIKMQSTPNFRLDLAIVIEAPNGDFVSYCGLWYEATNKIGFVEPMATDPDYRRMGLGEAVLMEGIKRCGELGASVAFVGSGHEFYRALGFADASKSVCWIKHIQP
jgi:predicted N-acetyltransferase YhbS